MKKFQLTFAVAACMFAAAGVFANSSVVTKYYRSNTVNQTGIHCDTEITAPTCATGTQCARKILVGTTTSLYYLSVATTFNGLGEPTDCAIQPGDVQQ